jgi:hypothetical protein
MFLFSPIKSIVSLERLAPGHPARGPCPDIAPRLAPALFRTTHPLGFYAARTTCPTHAVCPHVGPRRSNITSIEKKRRHRLEAAEGEEGDATPDLLLKHPNKTFTFKIFETLATCVRNICKNS